MLKVFFFLCQFPPRAGARCIPSIKLVTHCCTSEEKTIAARAREGSRKDRMGVRNGTVIFMPVIFSANTRISREHYNLVMGRGPSTLQAEGGFLSLVLDYKK